VAAGGAVAVGRMEDVNTPGEMEMRAVQGTVQDTAVFHEVGVTAASLVVHLKSHLQRVESVSYSAAVLEATARYIRCLGSCLTQLTDACISWSVVSG
jgi:hypothetical protein